MSDSEGWIHFSVLLAEGVYDQHVADDAGDADGEDDGADGVVGVVGHVHCGVRVRGTGHHRHLDGQRRRWINATMLRVEYRSH